MSVLTPPTPAANPTTPPPRSTRGIESGQLLVLHHVSYASYVAMADAIMDRPNVRFTYDRGALEIMTLSPEHERLKYLLGRLIDTLAEELNVRIGGFGSTTYRRQEAERGLEPDQCYYMTNLHRVRRKTRIDLAVDPPPDLAIEIDVTNSSVDRLEVYAGLNIPEVWRWMGESISVFRLNPAGGYDEGATSSAFVPELPVADLVRFVRIGESEDDTEMVRAFRAWVRQFLADHGLTS